MKHSQKLSEILPELEKQISILGKRIRPVDSNSRFSKKRAYTLLLLENYSEVILISRRIIATLNRISELQKLIFPPGAEEHTLAEAEVEKLVREHFELTSFLPLDVKSLYLWAAQITDIFKKSGVAIDLSELQRISLFRHNFITHIHETSFFDTSITTRAGVKYQPEKEQVAVLYHPFNYSKSRFTGMRTIVRKAIPFIPELASEVNYWEQLYMLYRHINNITNRETQREAKKLILRIGNATESPAVIVEALVKALISYRRA